MSCDSIYNRYRELDLLGELDCGGRVDDDRDGVGEHLGVGGRHAQVVLGQLAVDGDNLGGKVGLLFSQFVVEIVGKKLADAFRPRDVAARANKKVDGLYFRARAQQLLEDHLAHEARASGQEH